MADRQIKTATLQDFLTPKEIQRVQEIYRTTGCGHVAKAIREEIIEPNIDRINKSLGQENDPAYLAYACEYACMATGVGKQ